MEENQKSSPLWRIMDGVDAIVLAGTQGTRWFEINGRSVAKPYLELGGEPLVHRVVRAVLAAKRVRNVFVVGAVDPLTQALKPLLLGYPDRLTIVPEGEDLAHSCYRAYFQYLLGSHGATPMASDKMDPAAIAAFQREHPEMRRLPVLCLCSDLPFLEAKGLDRFIEDASEEAALTIGMVDHQELRRMQVALGEQTGLDQWKLGALHLQRQSVRINNLFLGRPMLADPAIYYMINELYNYRWLLRQDGSVNRRNWFSLGRSIVRHATGMHQRLRFWRGVFNFIPALLALFVAQICHRVGRWLSWPFRQFVGQRDLEFIGSMLSGVQVRMAVSRDLSSAIDIDVEDSYLSLAQEGEENFRRVARYLGQQQAGSSLDRKEVRVIAGGRR